MIRRRVLPLLLALSLSVPAFAANAARPSAWAAAVAAKGVENLYRVEPDLYRSARPAAEGFRELAALGVKTVLDVESPGDDAAVRGTAIRLFHVPMSAFGLRNDRVLAALRILADPANRPIVVHCHLGADRTGALIALYRVVVQGWSKEDAIREMDDGGYHHSSWWRNLDRYVAAADVDALRKELKIGKPAATLAAALGIGQPESRVESVSPERASTMRAKGALLSEAKDLGRPSPESKVAGPEPNPAMPAGAATPASTPAATAAGSQRR